MSGYSPMDTIVGIDPGATSTGIVGVTPDDRAHAVAIFLREPDEPLTTYASRVADHLFATFAGGTRMAIEGVVRPNPHMGLSNPGGIIDTAVVYGALWATLYEHYRLVDVPPAGHGSAPVATYPAALRGRAPRVGTGDRRHARSAYDVARAGRFLHRIGATR